MRHEPNYFGTFKRDVFLRDLGLCEEAISILLEGMESGRHKFSNVLEQWVGNPTARRFWEKHVGPEKMRISWKLLCTGFLKEYGEHPDEAMERFRKVSTKDV